MNAYLSDEILVKNILDGDDNAFTLLYDRYRRSVYLTAFRLIRNHEETQDAAQEIFTKLYRSLGLWSAQKSKLSTWIHRLAWNHSIDCLRVRHRRAESQLPENSAYRNSPVYSQGYYAQSPYTDVKNREEIDFVRRCVGKLPELQKNAFTHRYFHERKLVEIAEIENCKLATVKTSLHRATKAVRLVLLKSRGLSLNNMESTA
ncbi:MAG: sigma-70 family RNA polymerase sigma factor [Acidobacteria bacterium]|nr:sigma-70 family RNA polymerase sigma factor [Acidobacteriota bacterium]